MRLFNSINSLNKKYVKIHLRFFKPFKTSSKFDKLVWGNHGADTLNVVHLIYPCIKTARKMNCK